MNNDNKERNCVELFFERFSCCPKSDQELKWWASQLLLWAAKEDSLVMNSFAGEQMISPGRLTEWGERCPELASALRTAKAIVGARREQRALENKINAAVVMKTMALYNEEYHSYEKEMKVLGSDSEKQAQTINVVMPPMPSTDAVPKKRGRKKGS